MKQLAETMPAAAVSAEIEAFRVDAEDLGSNFRQAIGEAMLGEIDSKPAIMPARSRGCGAQFSCSGRPSDPGTCRRCSPDSAMR